MKKLLLTDLLPFLSIRRWFRPDPLPVLAPEGRSQRKWTLLRTDLAPGGSPKQPAEHRSWPFDLLKRNGLELFFKSIVFLSKFRYVHLNSIY